MSKLFITGTTGFLGTNLLKKAIEKKIDVVPINRKNCAGGIIYEDFSNCEANEDCVLIHCSALVHNKYNDYKDFQIANVLLTEKIAKISLDKKINKFIFLSSIGVLGSDIENVSLDSLPSPYDNYTLSKLEAENRLKRIFEGSSTKLVIVRPPIILGEGASGTVNLIKKFITHTSITPFGCFENERSVIKIDNLCDFLLNFEILNESLYMPSEENYYSTKDIFNTVASFYNKKLIHIKVPISLICLILLITNNSRLFRTLSGNLRIL